MSLAETLIPDTTAAQALETLSPQVAKRGYSPELLEENRAILIEFGKIACGLMIQEPDLEIPGSDIKLAFSDAMARQVVLLFMDGVEHALSKCADYRLEGDVKTHLVQNLAQHVFVHTKQLVASTIGQEATPDIQFGTEQLKDFVRNSAETTLSHFMAEYERTVGPLHPPVEGQADALSAALYQSAEEPPPDLAQDFHMEAPPPEPMALEPLQAQTPEPIPEEKPTPVAPPVEPRPVAPPAVQPPQPVVSAPAPQYPLGGYEKLGALALMMTALPGNLTDSFVRQLTPEQRANLGQFSQEPLKAVSQMDVRQVTVQLKNLSRHLLKAVKAARSKPVNPMAPLAKLSKRHSANQLLSTVHSERPWVQWTVQQTLTAVATGHPLPEASTQKLSIKTQTALVQYIQAQL